MSTLTKNGSNSKKKRAFAEVDSKVGNYEKHPFFVKKANEAKALLKEVGLPKKKREAK
jgi:hypothetical protein